MSEGTQYMFLEDQFIKYSGTIELWLRLSLYCDDYKMKAS